MKLTLAICVSLLIPAAAIGSTGVGRAINPSLINCQIYAEKESDISNLAPEGAPAGDIVKARKKKKNAGQAQEGQSEASTNKAGEGSVSGAGVGSYGSSSGAKVGSGGLNKEQSASTGSSGFSKGDGGSETGARGDTAGRGGFGQASGANGKEVEPSYGSGGFSKSNSGSDGGAEANGQSGFDQGKGANGKDPAAQLAKLDEMRAKRLITEEEYKLLRQTILEKMLNR
jgi:hypothetical protein